jgi:hypothetical protein
MTAPTTSDVQVYLGDTSYTTEEITAVLAAEKAAQAARVRVPADDADWPADLTEALLRRCARNLALRSIPLAQLQGDAEVGGFTPRVVDSEVRRLEAPWRTLVFG